MKFKFKSIIIGLLLLCTFSFVACRNNDNMEGDSGTVNENNNAGSGTTNENNNTDAVTSSSRANSVESFKDAVNNSWIVIVEKDLEVPEEATLKAGFKKAESEGSENLVNAPRVLAMYSGDSSGNIKNTYTLTIPKLTILDEGTKIKGGTLKGDVYVEADNVVFEQVTVEGNVYFKDQNAKDSCVMDEGSKVTGTMEIK